MSFGPKGEVAVGLRRKINKMVRKQRKEKDIKERKFIFHILFLLNCRFIFKKEDKGGKKLEDMYDFVILNSKFIFYLIICNSLAKYSKNQKNDFFLK